MREITQRSYETSAQIQAEINEVGKSTIMTPDADMHITYTCIMIL